MLSRYALVLALLVAGIAASSHAKANDCQDVVAVFGKATDEVFAIRARVRAKMDKLKWHIVEEKDQWDKLDCEELMEADVQLYRQSIRLYPAMASACKVPKREADKQLKIHKKNLAKAEADQKERCAEVAQGLLERAEKMKQ